MWTNLSDPWRACVEEAWAAYCADSIPVGAAVADANGRIVARGRNHTLDRDSVASDVRGNPLAHAEVNALTSLDYEEVDRHRCVLYTTTEPCPLCLGALYMSGLRELHYAGRDPFAGSVNLLGATPYLSRKAIRVVPPEDPLLEVVLTALTTDFGLGVGSRAEPVAGVAEWRRGLPAWLQSWREVLPLGVELGERVLASEWLQERRSRGAPASEVIDGLAELAQGTMKERR